jgi:hypothetical protein
MRNREGIIAVRCLSAVQNALYTRSGGGDFGVSAIGCGGNRSRIVVSGSGVRR